MLEELGSWDAHNVTEDADLGIRLARHGYRTELIDTVTVEEANCRPLPWIKQRSRWIKGYMMTWAVHMREPGLLWRQLGPRAFIGFQVLFLGTSRSSFWHRYVVLLLVPFGSAHPLLAACRCGLLGHGRGLPLSEPANLADRHASAPPDGHRLQPVWVLTMKLYFPLASLAAYKAR